jgi:hypothetical protein
MDDNRFDSIARQLGSGSSRRAVLKGLLGIGGVAAVGLTVHGQTDAARRGFTGPFGPTPVPTPTCAPDGAPCNLSNPGACCSQCCTTTDNGAGPTLCCDDEEFPV